MRTRPIVVLVLLALLGTARPAAAAEEVGLSLDGREWHERLTEPLFSPGTTWVPGDMRTVRFLVRNQATTDARMTVTVRAADRDDLLSDDHVTLRARSGGPWVTLRNGEPSAHLTPGSVDRGGIVRVELQAEFERDSSNASQTSRLSPRLEVTLLEAIPRPSDEHPDPDTTKEPRQAGALPGTGLRVPSALAWLGGAALAGGALLMRAASRQREDHDA